MKNVLTHISVSFLVLGLISNQTVSAYSLKIDPASSPLACVRFFVDRIDREERYERDNALSHLAWRYMELGKPQEAFQAASKLTCRELLGSAITVANQAIKDGNSDYAHKFIELGVGCINEDEFASEKNSTFSAFTKLLIELHQDDRALELSQLIDDDTSFKSEALARLAHSSISSGRRDQALELLERAFADAKATDELNDFIYSDTLRLIAEGFAQLNKPEQTAAVLVFAQAIAERAGGVDKERGLAQLTLIYANVGQPNEALQLAESLGADDPRIYISLAAVFVQRGEKERALALLSRATHDIELASDRDATSDYRFTDIVKVYLQADQSQLASHVLGKIDRTYYLRTAALAIADYWLKRGRSELAVIALDAAAEKLKLVESEPPEDKLVGASTSNGLEKARELSSISDKYTEARKYDKARQTIMAIDLPQWKAGKLAALANAMATTVSRASAGNILQEALTISEKAEERALDKEQLETLTAIAEGYAKVGNREKSLKLFARVLEEIRAIGRYEGLFRLTLMATRFEKSGLEADKRIKGVLRAIVKEWSEDD